MGHTHGAGKPAPAVIGLSGNQSAGPADTMFQTNGATRLKDTTVLFLQLKHSALGILCHV